MPSPEEHFAVHLHKRRIATLHRREDYTWLTFEPGYSADPDRAVLGLRFEEGLHARHAANLRLPPWFSNLLPEGSLRDWIADSRGTSVAREMELLVRVGHDLPGAVQVFAEDTAARRARDAGDEIVADAADPPSSRRWRFSLAGVGLKFSMLRRGDRFTAPGRGEGGDWIIKLPDPKHAAVPANEHAMMKLAEASSIRTPEVRLVDRDLLEDLPDSVWPEGERTAYAIRRFDRDADRSPIHIEDFAQVRGLYPQNKYTGSFETLAALVYRRRDTASLLELVRRLTFNILIRNGDAHLKNWSLLYEDPRVPVLAPAYDLVATGVYAPRGEPEDLGLKFGGQKRFEGVSRANFAALQAKLGVSVSLADEALAQIDRVLAAWPAVSEEILGAHPLLRDRIDAFLQQGAAALRR
jgi:serine/threonine-protein kinase HipA